jgi:hypothetical protein
LNPGFASACDPSRPEFHVSIHAQRDGEWVDIAGHDNIDHAPRVVKNPPHTISIFFAPRCATTVTALAASPALRLKRTSKRTPQDTTVVTRAAQVDAIGVAHAVGKSILPEKPAAYCDG